MFESDPKNATGHVLDKDKLPKYKVNWDDNSSLYNWIEQYELQCAPKNEWGMFGSLFFVGVVVSAFIMPRLSDNYGRKKISLSGTIGHFICSLGILVSHSLNFSLFMTFMLGFSMGGRVLVGYVWMTEHMQVKYVKYVTAFMFLFDSAGILVATIYFRFISKNWIYMFALPQFFLFFVICCHFKVAESPKFFYAQKDYFRCRWILTQIGRANGILGPNESYTKAFRLEVDEKIHFKKKEKEDDASVW